MRPERFAHGEPVRNSIEEVGIDGVVEAWEKPPSLMFKRVSAPKFTAEIRWRENLGKDTRPYPWGIRVWVEQKAGDGLVIEFFRFLIAWFKPAFGSVSLSSDFERKHFARYPYYSNGKRIGTAERYVGFDVGATLPGVYWLTYFGPGLDATRQVAILSDQTIERDARGGCLVRAYERSSDAGSEVARQKERVIAEHVGIGLFFDLERWAASTSK